MKKYAFAITFTVLLLVIWYGVHSNKVLIVTWRNFPRAVEIHAGNATNNVVCSEIKYGTVLQINEIGKDGRGDTLVVKVRIPGEHATLIGYAPYSENIHLGDKVLVRQLSMIDGNGTNTSTLISSGHTDRSRTAQVVRVWYK